MCHAVTRAAFKLGTAFGLEWPCCTIPVPEEHPMLDMLLLAAGVAFFALSIVYAFGCERL